jgi:hypothetical protein
LPGKELRQSAPFVLAWQPVAVERDVANVRTDAPNSVDL